MSLPILVTGASGFVGKHLVRALRAAGEEVIEHSLRAGTPAQPARHVYHLSARTYVPDSWAHPGEFYQTNLMGTVSILDSCREWNASLTLISSYLYGHPERLPIDEEHPVRAFNPYGHSKLLAEQTARFYEQHFEVPVTVVRPFNLYGPGQASDFLIPTLIRQALDPASTTIEIADDRPRRDYLYIADFVELLLLLRTAGSGRTYNAGSGASASVRDVAECIVAITGTGKSVTSRGEHRPNEVLDTLASVGRAREELGWTPKTILRDGLAQTIAAHESRR